jgi:hypothetical protein
MDLKIHAEDGNEGEFHKNMKRFIHFVVILFPISVFSFLIVFHVTLTFLISFSSVFYSTWNPDQKLA